MATDRTTARDLPQVAGGVDPSVRQPLVRVIEETQRLLGFRGDPLDAAITERRAREIGLTDSSGRALTGTVTYNNTYPTVGDGTPSTEPDLTPPPTPTGFTGVAGFSFVNLEWDNPGYTQGHGHGQTNVYGVQRSPPGSGSLPVFGDAQIIHVEYGTSPLTSVPSELNTRWHLWIKWKSVDGVESVAAAGGTNGLVLDTAQDVAQLLEALTGQITQSQLFADLSERVSQINTDADMVVQKFWGFDEDTQGWVGSTATLTWGGGALTWAPSGTNGNANVTFPAGDRFPGADAPIVRARVKRLTGTGAWEGQCYYRTDVAGAQPDAHGYSNSYRKTIAAPADPDIWNVLEWDMAALTPGGTDWLDREIQGLRIDLVSDGGTSTWAIDWIAVGATSITPLTARIAQEESVRADETGDLFAQYTVKIDLNGYVTGYGLAATAVDGVPTSSFVIRADRFAIAPPTFYTQATAPTGLNNTTHVGRLWKDTDNDDVKTWDGDSWEVFTNALPFIVQATATTEGGIAIPPGTYIDAAYIKNLTAVYARIQTLVADDITAADISAAQITGGTMQVGSFIQSTNYTSGGGGNGWRINADGTAFLQAAYIRGLLTASQINGNGLSINTSGGTSILSAGGSGSLAAGVLVGGTAASTIVARTAVGPNLIADPDLANAASGDTTSAGWTRFVGGTATQSQIFRPTSTPSYGPPWNKNAPVFYASVDAASEDVEWRSKDFIEVDEDNTYTLACWARQYLASEVRVYYGLACYDDTDALISSVYLVDMLFDTLPESWVRYSGKFGPGGVAFPAGTVKVKVRWLGAYNTSGTSFTGRSMATRFTFNEGTEPTTNYAPFDPATAAAAQAAYDAVNDAATGLENRLLKDAADVLSGVVSVNVVSGSAGFRAGNIVWNTSGVRTSGYGVAMTTNGLIGYNSAGQLTFALNATTGDLTLGNSLAAATGHFAGALVAATGTFSGTLTAAAINAVDTINLAGESVTIPRYQFSAGNSASVTIVVPSGKGGARVAIMGAISSPRSGYGQYVEVVSTPGGTTTLRNESVVGGSIPALNAGTTLGVGSHVITVSSDDPTAFNAFVYAQYTMK